MADPTRISTDDLSPMVSSASKQYGVPEELIWNVIKAENSGSAQGAANLRNVSTQAVSSKNARGVMQVTPIALQDVQQAGLIPNSVKHDSLSTEDQINVGTAYLSRLLKLSQDPKEVYAMYNYGPKARFRMDELPAETQDYLNKTGSSSSESSTLRTSGGRTGSFAQGAFDSGDLIGLLLKSGQEQNQQMSTGLEEMLGLQSQGQALQSQGISQQQQVVGQAALNAAAKANVDYKAQKNIENMQVMFGLNPDQANNEIAKSLSIINDSQAAYQPARQEYDQLASKSILDDPLGWIIAQVKLPSAAAKVNAIVDEENKANLNIQTRTANLNAAKATITANTADQLRDIQLKQAEIGKQQADAQLSAEQGKNTIAAATSKMQAISVANQLGDNTRNTLVAVTNLEDRAESQELRNAQRQQIMEGKKLKDEEEARLNARLKVISDSKGMFEPMTVARLKTLTDKKSQEEWLSAAQSGGFGEKLDESLKFYLGNGSSKTAIQNGGGASVWNTAEKLARQGSEYIAMADRVYAKQDILGKKPSADESKARAYDLYKNTIVDSSMKANEMTDLSSSQWDRTYNPYVAPFVGFNKALAAFPSMAALNNNEMKKSIDTLISTGAVTTENLTAAQQQQVIKSLTDKVYTRQLEPKKAAADISQYMKSISAYNRDLNKYDLFSLPRQSSYFFTLEGDLGVERKKTDLFDPVTLERDLISQVRQRNEPAPFAAFR